MFKPQVIFFFLFWVLIPCISPFYCHQSADGFHAALDLDFWRQLHPHRSCLWDYLASLAIFNYCLFTTLVTHFIIGLLFILVLNHKYHILKLLNVPFYKIFFARILIPLAICILYFFIVDLTCVTRLCNQMHHAIRLYTLLLTFFSSLISYLYNEFLR